MKQNIPILLFAAISMVLSWNLHQTTQEREEALRLRDEAIELTIRAQNFAVYWYNAQQMTAMHYVSQEDK